jgi:hypothetical protein
MAIGKMDKYQIATNITLLELDSFEGKMSAKMQIAAFGANLFGRKSITIKNEGQGKIEVRYSAAYGTDQVFTIVTFEQIANAVNNNRLLGL